MNDLIECNAIELCRSMGYPAGRLVRESTRASVVVVGSSSSCLFRFSSNSNPQRSFGSLILMIEFLSPLNVDDETKSIAFCYPHPQTRGGEGE